MGRTIRPGIWRGRFEYNDRAFAAADDGFCWQLGLRRFGGVVGVSNDDSGLRATVSGRISRRGVRLRKMYEHEGGEAPMVDSDGTLRTLAEICRGDAIRPILEHAGAGSDAEYEALARRLAEDIAHQSALVVYEGSIESESRMSGTWSRAPARVEWASLSIDGEGGSWWAAWNGDADSARA